MVTSNFQKTDVGFIPQDWEMAYLGDVFTITSSKRIFQNEWKTSGIPFLRAREIALMDEGKKPNYEIYISNDLYQKYTMAYGAINEGDLLISGVGTVGKVYVVKSSDKFYFKDGNIIWLKRHKLCCSYFIKLLYYSPVVINQILGNSAGSTVVTYTIQNAKKTKVPFPPVEEQQAIAEALSDIDRLIASTEKLIAKKKAIKQGLMQELLTGKRRLPRFDTKKTQESEFGIIPANWKIYRIQDIFHFYSNNTLSRSCMNENCGKIKNIHYGDILTRYDGILDCMTEKIPYLNDHVKIKMKRAIQSGDIIFADTAEDEIVGKAIEVVNVQNEVIVSGLHTVWCCPDAGLFVSGFLGLFLNSYAFHSKLLPFITGIKVSSISKNTIKDSLVLCPPLKEQQAVVELLRNLDGIINALCIKMEKYQQIKQGMMSELLTGRIRLLSSNIS